jgi:hypothetical protein
MTSGYCISQLSSRQNVLFFLYFVLGFQVSFSGFAMFMDFLDFDISIYYVVYAVLIIYLPWQLKFIPAILSDIYAVNGYHRKPYIILSNICASLMCLLLTQKFKTSAGYIMCQFLLNMLICVADVNYDACIAEDTKKEDKDSKGVKLNRMITSRTLGKTLGEITGPLAWSTFDSATVFYILAAACIVNFLAGMILNDTSNVSLIKGNDGDVHVTIEERMQLVKESLSDPKLIRIILYNYTYAIFPGYGIPMFYYIIGPLDFTPFDVSILNLISGAFSVVGSYCYQYIKDFNIRYIYIFSSICSILITSMAILLTLRMTFDEASEYFDLTDNPAYLNSSADVKLPLSSILGLNNFMLVLSDDCLGSFARYMKALPLLTYTSMSSRPSVEASTTAFVLSGVNIASTINKSLGGMLLKQLGINADSFDTFHILIIICACFEVIGLLLVFWTIPSMEIKDINPVEEVSVEHPKCRDVVVVDPSIYSIPR